MFSSANVVQKLRCKGCKRWERFPVQIQPCPKFRCLTVCRFRIWTYTNNLPVCSLLELNSSIRTGTKTPKPCAIPMIRAWDNVAHKQTTVLFSCTVLSTVATSKITLDHVIQSILRATNTGGWRCTYTQRSSQRLILHKLNLVDD